MVLKDHTKHLLFEGRGDKEREGEMEWILKLLVIT